MTFNRRIITKELDPTNLQRHNDNYADIEASLDGHDVELATVEQHMSDNVIHTSQAEKDKLANIQAGAEVNQNAFSKIMVDGQGDVDAGAETDALTFTGGTGIAVSTDPSSGKVTFTATGEAIPGAHALSHLTGGADAIPLAVSGGQSGLMSGADKADFDKLKIKMFGASSVVSFPCHAAFRAWQGVCTDGKYIYVVTDNPETGVTQDENIISVYDMFGNFVAEKRNAYAGADSAGRFMSFGTMSYLDGLLYVPVYNYNSGGPAPYESRIVQYSSQDNGLNELATYEIGSGVAEGIAKHLDHYWVSYHDIQKIRRFNSNWVQIAEYELPTLAKSHGGYQGIIWENGFLHLNMHGPNSKGQPFVGGIDKFSFDGTVFTFVESFNPPSFGSTQGMSTFDGLYLFNDRTENRIIITNSLKPGKLKAETLRTPQERLIDATFTHGWEIFDLTYDRRPRFYKDESGRVHLSGICKNTDPAFFNGIEYAIFQLPPGYQPKYSLNFPVVTNGAFGRLSITGMLSSDGQDAQKRGLVVPNGSIQAAWVSLDGISFLADTDDNTLV